MFFFDVLAFVLAVYKSWSYLRGTPFRGRTFTMQLVQVMLRDSIIYFLFIVLAYTTFAMMDALAPPTLDYLLDGLLLSVMSILGTRMMINVRETRAQNQPRVDINALHISGSSDIYEMHYVASRAR